MTPNDQIIINDAIRKLRENVTSGMLLMESLSALLPKQKKEKPRGYIIDPETNDKLWFDKTAKRRHERNKKLTIIK